MQNSLCDGAPPIQQTRLERHLQRLERQLQQLEAVNARFSLYRLAAFVVGALAVGLAGSFGGETAGWIMFGLSAAMFLAIVALHRRLDGWRQRFSTWRDLRRAQLARLQLDWTALPPAAGAENAAPGAERCALDIDLDLSGPRSLHRLLDLAISEQGSRRLAAWLCSGQPDPAAIAQRQAVARELAGLPRFRDRLLLALRLISKEPLRGDRLLDWLKVESSLPRLRRLLWIGAALTTLNALLFGLGMLELIPPVWPISFTIYLAFYLGTRLSELLDATARLDTQLDTFSALLRHLESYPLPGRPHLAGMLAPFRTPGRLPSAQVRRVKAITAAIGLRMNPVMAILVNAFFPWDILFAYLAARLQQQMRPELPAWLETWYELEALSSLGAFAWLHPEYAWPQVDEQAGLLQAVGMGHPLLAAEKRVCNDFSIPGPGQVYLVTGSNMAGKSTFIKTLGINLCLAYAGGPVCAGALRS
ncbi:MAG: hypothetical protein ACKOC5_12440, partial [Chloroflexota bacterium]